MDIENVFLIKENLKDERPKIFVITNPIIKEQKNGRN